MTRSLRWLKDDIALRMMQKLELLKHQPRSLLIIPDAPGVHANRLAKRFPKAALSSIPELGLSWADITKMKLARTCGFITNGLSRFPTMREGRLALGNQSQDMVFSNLWIHSLGSAEMGRSGSVAGLARGWPVFLQLPWPRYR